MGLHHKIEISSQCIEVDRFKKHMCSTCKYFKDNNCTKHRIASQCAKKGLKNK